MDADQRVSFLQKVETALQKPENEAKKTLEVLAPMDPEIAGDGQYFCGFCSRHFISYEVLKTHEASKTHKRRRKEVIEESNTIDQELISELAVGYSRETKKPRT
jgi:hypothetical protein